MVSIRPLTQIKSNQAIPMYRDTHRESRASVKLDLNSLCVRKPTETFFILVGNPNLLAWGIEQDDLLVVEKSQHYYKNDLLVLEQHGQYKFYQFFNETNGEIVLFSLDVREKNLRIQSWDDVSVAGVITNVVHQMRHRFSTERKYA